MRPAARLQLHWILASTLAGAPLAAQSAARFEDAPAASGAREYWATGAARRLHQRALEYERRADVSRALVAYTDALALDAGYGPAWLGLGRLRAAIRDDAEAERVLIEASRFQDLAPDALFELALVRRRTGRTNEALRDLERSIAQRPRLEPVRLLSSWYVQLRAWPAALAAWRRLAAALEEEADHAIREEAALQLSALQLLAAETDPVWAGKSSNVWERRALARIARRNPR